MREALEFSALLRQPRNIPRAEKLAYVDEVLDILEMTSYQHAVVGNLVSQRQLYASYMPLTTTFSLDREKV